jgi:hypothetical protein
MLIQYKTEVNLISPITCSHHDIGETSLCAIFILGDIVVWVRVMVLNTTFSNISVKSWLSVLLVDETGVPGENH